jgi:hypothetical protein
MTTARATLKRPTDAAATVPDRCCGREVRSIDIATPEATLTFTFCGGCEAARWFRDGVQVERDDLGLSAMTGWARSRVA